MNQLKETISNLSNDYGETNDCTVRALAVALNGDYRAAHSACKAHGRKKGRGTNIRLWRKAFLDCGFELDDVTDNFDGQTIRTVERELKARKDGHKYLLNVSSHVAAWDGSHIVDWAAGRLHRIQNVFHMRPIHEDKQWVRAKVVVPVEVSHLTDCTFVMHKEGGRDGNWRIYIRENGKVRWLNTKRWKDDAEDAAYRAGELKRGITYAGYVDSSDDLADHYDAPGYSWGY